SPSPSCASAAPGCRPRLEAGIGGPDAYDPGGEARRTMIEIRTASAAEVALLIDWAAAEGWNPGLDDARLFRLADPEGFLVAVLDGRPVAGISVVASGDAFGFLGLYICRPEHRGRGHGYGVWQAGIARLGDRTIGLDGVVAQQANYARSGFSL